MRCKDKAPHRAPDGFDPDDADIGSRLTTAGPKPPPEWAKIDFRRGGGFVITAGNGKAQLHIAAHGTESTAALEHDSRIVSRDLATMDNCW
jgi:hypothetical protein